MLIGVVVVVLVLFPLGCPTGLAFFCLLGDLVAGVLSVEGLGREDAVEGGDAACLFDGFEALHFGLVLVDDHHGVDLVELVQVSDASFD
jgi:hypothetical protein